jgi:hypothetical protein
MALVGVAAPAIATIGDRRGRVAGGDRSHNHNHNRHSRPSPRVPQLDAFFREAPIVKQLAIHHNGQKQILTPVNLEEPQNKQPGQLPDLERLGVALLGDLSELWETLAPAREQLPGYDAIPLEQLRSQSMPTVHELIEAVCIRQHPPTEMELEWAEAAAEARARAGVPLRSLLQGLLVIQRGVWSAALEHGRTLGISEHVLLDMGSRMLEWIQLVSARGAETYARVERETARLVTHQRAQLINDLLLGARAPSELREQLAALDFRFDTDHSAFRARSASPTDLAALEQQLAGEPTALVGSIGADLAGIVRRPPLVRHKNAIIAIGPPADLGSLPASFRTATRVLQTAVAFGMRGTLTLDDVHLRPAILAETEIGERLFDRYLAPLTAERSGSIIEESVRALFEHSFHIERTAKALHIHPNTIRYRISRYEEITGARLTNIEDLAGVWWSLTRRHADELAARHAKEPANPPATLPHHQNERELQADRR